MYWGRIDKTEKQRNNTFIKNIVVEKIVFHPYQKYFNKIVSPKIQFLSKEIYFFLPKKPP